MRAHSTIPLQSFTIDVAFFSDEDQFATETYMVWATTWFTAQLQGLELSVGSVYDNARIPGLRRIATVRQG
ncbi:hypothetical protein J2X73_004597 [Novosphingobium sp. 1748]|uniref:hypothetical protein n=1 Tax=Novosphingobium sp. 1748 TaxID=2817760 RepID=UPI00285D3909|nr:hypothetical protein [Novosphingobium sp. 1748]MDR6710192.1 hypothetical protein [Novosphingobium sp. 1748]